MSQAQYWGAMLRKAVGLQVALVLSLSVVVWLIWGLPAGRSALLGGMAVALPNVLFAFWLMLRLRVASASSAPAMMAGEMLKLGLTLMLLASVAQQPQEQLSWPALLIGVLAALKGHWLALLIMRR